jgi:TolB-like protein
VSDPRGPRGLLAELKRRNVYKVGVSYLVAAFVVVQIADLASGAFGLPAWFQPMAWVASAIGLPIALVLAWAYDLGPDGIRRTTDEEDEPGVTGHPDGGTAPSAPRGLAGTAAWLALLAAGLVGGWALMDSGPSEEVRRTIAVLPFDATGGTAGVEFGRGLHDGLLTRLTNVGDLTVKSRTSVERYAGSTATIPDIARAMDVAWLVEGAVDLAGNRVRVNATLIDARTDDRLWARDYERDLTIDEVFDIQSDLARRIAESLEAEISPREMQRLEGRPTDNLEAYRLTVMARTYLERRTEPAVRRSIEHFESALALDSAYALAWTGLADAWTLLHAFDRSDTIPPLAKDAVARALALDPDLGEAHATKGYQSTILAFHAPLAHEELTLATELNPGYAPAFHWLASLEVRRGEFEAALEPMRRAVELDPFSPTIRNVLGLLLWITEGPGPAALAELREAQSIEPGFALPHMNEALVLSTLERHAEALAAAERAMELATPGSFDWGYTRGAMATVLARAGETDRARSVLDRLRAERIAPFWEAMALGTLGDVEEAFTALDRVRWTSFLWWDAQALPIMDPLRADPRYDELIRSLNVRWGLEPDGSLPGAGPP